MDFKCVACQAWFKTTKPLSTSARTARKRDGGGGDGTEVQQWVEEKRSGGRV